MSDRAFVIMQVGSKDSDERRRADEIYNFIIKPAVEDAGLEPYRADLDFSPGAITTKFLSELLTARLVIADLTGRNPNVFYELGITHSFARPLVAIADSSTSLPFDAKDERVIELGEYPPTGLTYVQGESAKSSLQQSLEIVLAVDYIPPSPMRGIAASRSIDDLAPENPLAALASEMTQFRDSLEEIRKRVTPRTIIPPDLHADIEAMREVLARNVGYLDDDDFAALTSEATSSQQDKWAEMLRRDYRRKSRSSDDPWSSEPADSGFSDEPPF
jgi:hypothetical protein